MTHIISNNKQVKKVNRIKVLDIIRRNDCISRKQLAVMTGLTPPAITGIVKELIERGFIEEVGLGNSHGGRKPVSLVFKADFVYILGIEISKNTISWGFTDMKNPPNNVKHFAADMSDPDKASTYLIELIKTVLQENADKNFLGVGIAVPGLVLADTGTVARSVNLGPAWKNYALLDKLQSQLSVPIFLDNNSNVAVLAEKIFDLGINYSDIAYVNIGDGLSAGVILSDNLVKGNKGFSGEIGHITLHTRGATLCNCGNRGCLETVCSLTALLRKIEVEMPFVDEQDPAKQFYLQRQCIGVRELQELLPRNSKYLNKIFLQFADSLAIAISTVINMFNPEIVIIGGKMAMLLENFLPELIKRTKGYTFPELFEDTQIVISNMREEASVSGACALALQEILSFSNNNLFDKS